jgi:uncharacterized membrane protein
MNLVLSVIGIWTFISIVVVALCLLGIGAGSYMERLK